MAAIVFGNIYDKHRMPGCSSFDKDIAGIDFFQEGRDQLPFKRPGTAIHKYFIKIGIEGGTAGGIRPVAGPFQEVEAGALLRIEIDLRQIVPGIAIFGSKAHDGVGALLKIGMADGDIQHGVLGALVALAGAVKKIDGPVLLQGYHAKPEGKRITVRGNTVEARWRRYGSDGGIGVERLALAGCEKQQRQQGHGNGGFHAGKTPAVSDCI